MDKYVANEGQCVSAIHTGIKNPNFKYRLMKSELAETKTEIDFEVVEESSVKISKQCRAPAEKANTMLGMIRKGIENKTASIVMPLYTAVVWPHLDFCVKF